MACLFRLHQAVVNRPIVGHQALLAEESLAILSEREHVQTLFLGSFNSSPGDKRLPYEIAQVLPHAIPVPAIPNLCKSFRIHSAESSKLTERLDFGGAQRILPLSIPVGRPGFRGAVSRRSYSSLIPLRLCGP